MPKYLPAIPGVSPQSSFFGIDFSEKRVLEEGNFLLSFSGHRNTLAESCHFFYK